MLIDEWKKRLEGCQIKKVTTSESSQKRMHLVLLILIVDVAKKSSAFISANHGVLSGAFYVVFEIAPLVGRKSTKNIPFFFGNCPCFLFWQEKRTSVSLHNLTNVDDLWSLVCFCVLLLVFCLFFIFFIFLFVHRATRVVSKLVTVSTDIIFQL